MADATLPAVIFASFVMVLGVVGNSVVCYICHCRLRRSVLNNFVLSLAALDLMGCVLCVPMEITELRNRLLTFDPALCISQRFFRNVHIICSVFVLVAIATERYRRICNPLSRHITLRQCRVAIISVLILAVLLSWPSLFIFGGRVTTFETEAVPISAAVPLPVPSSTTVTTGHAPIGGGGVESGVNRAVVDGGSEGRILPTLLTGTNTADRGGRSRVNDSSIRTAGGRKTDRRPLEVERDNDNNYTNDDDSVKVVVMQSTECAVKDSMKGSIYPVIYFSFLFLLFFASSAVLCGLYARIACSIWRPRKLRTDTRTKSASLPDCRRLNAVFNNNNNSNSNSNAAVAAIKAFHANQRSLRPGGVGAFRAIGERGGGNGLCNGDDENVSLTASGCRRQNTDTAPLKETGGDVETKREEEGERGEENPSSGDEKSGNCGDGSGVGESPADYVERRDVFTRPASAAQRLHAVFSALTLPFKGKREKERDGCGVGEGCVEKTDDVRGLGDIDLLRRRNDAVLQGDVTLPRPANCRRLNYSLFPETSSLVRGVRRAGIVTAGRRGDISRNSTGDGGGVEPGSSNSAGSCSNRKEHTSTLPMPRRLYDELTRSLQLRRKRESTALSAMNVNTTNYYNCSQHPSSGGSSHINNLLLVVPTLSFRRKKRAAYSRKRTTFIMFLMTLTSVVSYLPFVLVSIVYVAASSIGSHNKQQQQPWGQRSVAERAIIDLCLKSFLISSAVNPLIYGFCNQRFKKECAKILEGFNRCRRRKVTVETEDTSDTPANT